jgi:hypothetical protein
MWRGLWEEEGFPQEDNSQEKKDDPWNLGAGGLHFQGGTDMLLL